MVHSPRAWGAGLAAVWLVPFLAAASASTERLNQWESGARVTSDYLLARATTRDRVWASPTAYRWVVPGKVSAFGFLAHDWPLYFGALRNEAESYAHEYHEILQAPSVDSVFVLLVQNRVDWIIIDESTRQQIAWDPSGIPSMSLDSSTPQYSRGDSREFPETCRYCHGGHQRP